MRIFITAFLCALTALPNLGHSQEKAIAYYDKKVTFSDKLAGVSPSITALPHFSKLLREGMTLHQFLQQGEASFSRLIERKDYIDTEEYTYHLSRETNQRRRQQLTTLLRYDENLDGTIEREEAIGTLINEAKSERSNPMTATHAELVKQADFLFVHHDRNKDGVITFTEMAELVKALEPFHRHPSRSDEIYGFLKVDTDGDGKITPEEARTILTGMFADADTNGDNTISKDEATSMKHRAETASKKSQCAVDKLDPKSRVIVLGVKGGEYYSSVDLTGAQEQVTAVRIKIEEQKKPLTLFLLSEKPTVFDIQGDTSKIQKVVIPYTADERRRHGLQRLSGVTNVPKEQVTFESDICNYSIHDDSVKTEEHYTGAFLERFGRSPDLVVGQETAGDIVLHADRLEFAQKRTVMDNPSPKQNGRV